MKKINYIIFSIICIISSTIVFAQDEITIKSITPVYKENSGLKVEGNEVTFNDKDQSIEYKVILENNTNKDYTIEDVNLSKTSEEFLIFDFSGLDKNDTLPSNSTKEVTVTLKTIKKEGWGRNFNDQLSVNININNKIQNPNTETKSLLVVLILMTFITIILIISTNNKIVSRYIVLVLSIGSLISITSAKELFTIPIKFNVNYESQNIMQPCYIMNGSTKQTTDYWKYSESIKDIYFENELREITEYQYKFDVSNENNNKVIAYLLTNKDNSNYYDLYIIGDGIIYFNNDSSSYFQDMKNLSKINNLEGIDTSLVTDMSNMFRQTGYNTQDFKLDLSTFNTENVTTLSYMFFKTGFSSKEFTLDVSNFDTSNVTNMSGTFASAGYSSDNFILDISNFNTSNVSTMYAMFNNTGYNSAHFNLKPGDFDTSKVTDLTSLFQGMGYQSDSLNFDITFRNPNVSSYKNIFSNTAKKAGTSININYTEETKELINNIAATISTNPNIEIGKMYIEQENLSIGDEIHIKGERFNIASIKENTITLLAQYNLGPDYKQSTTENYLIFSDRKGWEYTPGPKEIDIETYTTDIKKYIKEYKTYIESALGENLVNIDLMSVLELKELGCTIKDDYTYEGTLTCAESNHVNWLTNNQQWWTKSASSECDYILFTYDIDGTLDNSHHKYIKQGIRPTIKISQETLKEYLNS